MAKRKSNSAKPNEPADKSAVETEELRQRVQDLTADLQRIQADFINFKRRAEEDKQRAIRFGRESAVMALLSGIDNVERALAHIPKRLENDEWAAGVKSVAKQLDDALRGIGVERIKVEGAEFNPELHEAISVDENSSPGKKEVVIEELQPGYTMDGEVIRHSIVKVGRK